MKEDSPSAWFHVAPSHRHDLVNLLVSALVSFGVAWWLAGRGGYNNDKVFVTSVLISAYAAPVLSAWPGAWVVGRVTAAHTMTFGETRNGVEIGAKRLPLAPLAETPILQDILPSGVLHFAVRTRRPYAMERIGFGVCLVALAFFMGEWALFVILFLGILLLPTLWTLAILDLTGWSQMDVGNGAIRLGSKVVPIAQGVRVVMDGEMLRVAPGACAEHLRSHEIRAWSRPGRRGDGYLRFVKASIELAVTASVVTKTQEQHPPVNITD